MSVKSFDIISISLESELMSLFVGIIYLKEENILKKYLE